LPTVCYVLARQAKTELHGFETGKQNFPAALVTDRGISNSKDRDTSTSTSTI